MLTLPSINDADRARLLAFTCRLLPANRSYEAEDVLHRAVINCLGGCGCAKLESYIRWAIRSELRKSARHPGASTASQGSESFANTPPDQLELNEAWSRVEQKLTSGQRRLLSALRRSPAASASELALDLDVTANAVRSQMARLRRRFLDLGRERLLELVPQRRLQGQGPSIEPREGRAS